MFEAKITNKQGITPNPRVHHHKQGLTCDCRQCGTEFTQYHNRHVLCGKECDWIRQGLILDDLTCVDCGCTDRVPVRKNNYRCETCKKFKLNPTRTDIQRRTPSPT